MVCYVGLNNGLTKTTKDYLLNKVGLLSDDGKEFNVGALNQMLKYEALKNQIKHYLGFNQSRTRDIGQEFNNDYINGKLDDAVVESDSALDDQEQDRSMYASSTHDSSTPDSSSDGGKSRRKHKKTSKRKPKSKKTRRKRSLINRAKAWGK